MKFAVAADQRDYFRKHGVLPLSELLQPSELDSLNAGIQSVLKKVPTESQFIQGRDLWRKDDRIKKMVFSKRLTELAFELLQKKPLRLAFDQTLPKRLDGEVPPYPDTDWRSFSCIGDMLGLYILDLSSDPDDPESLSGYFLLPSTPFTFSSLDPKHTYFIIGYCGPYGQYLYQPADPQVHFLKNLGYVFGDKLNENKHPIVFR